MPPDPTGKKAAAGLRKELERAIRRLDLAPEAVASRVVDALSGYLTKGAAKPVAEALVEGSVQGAIQQVVISGALSPDMSPDSFARDSATGLSGGAGSSLATWLIAARGGPPLV